MDIINDSAKLLYEAAKFVVEKQECTETGIQRKFKLGYNAAYRITEQLEALGVVGKKKTFHSREIKCKNMEDLQIIIDKI